METEQVSPGKNVANNVYLHRDAIPELQTSVRSRVWAAEALAGGTSWNVVKIRRQGGDQISLLTYEDFETPFPALLESLTINIGRGSVVRRWSRRRGNPPILHRKELLLPTGHPRRDAYAGLTADLERHGLFRDRRYIGTRRTWEQRLRAAGIEVTEHKVRQATDLSSEQVIIHRHLAAIRRDGFSLPIQTLLKYEIIELGTTVFDYGCGFGSDVEGLLAAGIDASGWDPHYSPSVPGGEADVVNLGFVLNVIEQPSERVDVLRAAYALARKCLAVAVITTSRARQETLRSYGDGFVTQLGTFQKFYRPEELRMLIEQTLGREAVPAGPNLFFVFADEISEQNFLVTRQSRRAAPQISLHERRRSGAEAARDALRLEIEALSSLAEELGRWPAQDEVPEDVLEQLKEKAASFASALRLAKGLADPTALNAAAERRRTDLQVYFALNEFNRRSSYGSLPARLQRDVRWFFRSHKTAQSAGRSLLFSLGDTGILTTAAKEASASGLGYLDEENCFWICAEAIPQLPASLRCYAGCAEKYSGSLEDAHLLKFHLRSGKLTALRYADFEFSPLPVLVTRIKIDLRRQRIFDFDHGGEDQRLLLKSRFMASDQLGIDRQNAFDHHARTIGLEALGIRATGADIAEAARFAGFTWDGWRWATIPAVS